MTRTHEVTNQPPPLEGYDVFTCDRALVEGFDRWADPSRREALVDLGRLAGTREAIELGFTANASPPVLRSHDRYGHRVDRVEYHPAYHELMRVAVGHGLHGTPWTVGADRGAHVTRAAQFIVWSQVDAGHGCPISMTYSVVPALRQAPELAAVWEPGLTSTSYDRSDSAPAGKHGLLAGMGMTEKQGGSDVRANTTRAEPDAEGYRLTGHKWFCSAPMSDVFLMLAKAPGGLTCFVVPRRLPDGSQNEIRLERLKDKLGNRSNASSEIELERAWARRLGEEGRGVSTITTMVNHTRLDCVLGATATMRQALTQAVHHSRHRQAFGKLLVDQPLMRNVLADLALESEAATAVAMRLARAYDSEEPREAAFRRLATAVAKYWVCKRQPAMVAEALECLGGNGYVEESMMPRLFRESPLNGIWEGSGSVMCLDVLRAANREPASLDAFAEELVSARGAHDLLDRTIDRALRAVRVPDDPERDARRVVEDLALAFQASLLVRHAPNEVADGFVLGRLGAERGHAFGTLPSGAGLERIIERSWPAA